MNGTSAALLLGFALMLTGCASPENQQKILATQSGPNKHQLILIPTETYYVGANGHPQNPRRKVRLNHFHISDAETTNEQFARFIEATGYITDAEKRGYGLVAREGMIDWAWDEVDSASWRHPMGTNGPDARKLSNHPVTQISGADAEAYCLWIGGRLPTLDEWEVAARAGSSNRWPWGRAYLPSRANIWNGVSHRRNTLEDGWVYTSPVRSFPPNAWGLYDVIGNVFEYCADLPPRFRPEDARRLIAGRGGSWWCSSNTCNFFNLEDIGTMDRHGSLANQGFRVVFDNRE